MSRFNRTEDEPRSAYFGPKRTDKPITLPPLGGGFPILAIDPGGTTGWSLIHLPFWHNARTNSIWSEDLQTILRNRVTWTHGEIDTRTNELKSCDEILKIIRAWPNAAVILEDFILRPERRESARELLSPVRINAVLTYELWRDHRVPIFQSAGMAKTTCTDPRLKAWGVYTSDGGLQHARDADRHVVLFIRRCMGNNPGSDRLREMVWPRIVGKK